MLNRKTDPLHDALENCIVSVRAGQSLEEALRPYPMLQAVLEPLLQTMLEAEQLRVEQIPQAAMHASRARMLQHAASQRTSTTFFLADLLSSLWGWAMPMVTVLVLFLVVGGGLVTVSNASLPGDALYAVKRNVEDTQLAYSTSPDSLQSELDARRIEEITELLALGREEAVEFVGIVDDQSGEEWQIAGLRVRISAESITPNIGDRVRVQGSTTANRWVNANTIEILTVSPATIDETTPVPTQMEPPTTDSSATTSLTPTNTASPNATEAFAPTSTPEPTNSIVPTATEDDFDDSSAEEEDDDDSSGDEDENDDEEESEESESEEETES